MNIALKTKITVSVVIRYGASGENSHKSIRDPVTQGVVETTKPLFERLDSPYCSASVENNLTQNGNQSFHHLVHGYCSQKIYIPLQSKQIFFNEGYVPGKREPYSEMDIKVSGNMENQ